MTERTIAGRYTLLARLGQGGFGDVWRASDAMLGREVAIKLVDASIIGHAPQFGDIVTRFKREALAVGGLRHANIVTAFDAGQDGSVLYLVMELVPGSSLADILEDRRDRALGPMPVTDVLDFATQACAGLDCAHAAGVVHRDVKPANLMIDPSGQLKIIDFGIARVVHDDMPRLTAPGSGVGTLAYVAPEQAQGLEVDGRADLYSLGCMMYELLAGERPFAAAIPAVLLNKQLSETPTALRSRRPDVPGSLAALISQLMEKSPADRPANAQQVADRLTAIRQGLEQARARGARVPEAERPTVLAGAGSPDTQPHLPSGQYRPTVLAGEAGAFPDTVDSAAAVSAEPAARSAERAAEPRVERPADRPDWWRQDAGGPRRPASRRGWWALAAACVVLAAAGAVIAVIARHHNAPAPLAVTAAAVAPANQPTPGRCNVTVDVVGTIFTNGTAGTVSYQWIRHGGKASPVQTSPVQTANLAAGQTSVQVRLYWSFKGRGTIEANATLRVLSPRVADATTSVLYSCR